MKKSWNIFLGGFALLGSLAGCQAPEQTSTPQTTRFNNDWAFIIAADSSMAFSSEAEWNPVSLPHTPKIEPLVVNDQWQGICWYKKTFPVDFLETGQQAFLKFDGAMNAADVWINGVHACTHLGGYLPFTIPVTPFLNVGELNEVVVRLDNTDNPVTGPKPLSVLDFNMYGGLYRDAWLIVKNGVYITDPVLEAIPAGGGIFVSFPAVSPHRAVVQIKTHLRNTTAKGYNLKVNHELWLKKTLVTSTTMPSIIDAGKAEHLLQSLEVEKPQLWSTTSPVLYSLVTKVFSGKNILDTDTTLIGIKHLAFKDNQLYLNGNKTFLRGVNRHQEYPYLGYALSREANFRDAVKIKEAGFDYVRLSHYPQSPAFMEACDELGLLVIDPILGWQYYSDDTAFGKHVYQTARDLIRRDRNHACVLAWEVSLNESWMPEPFIDGLHAIAHEEVPGDQCFTAGWQEYGYDIYLQARQHRLKHYTPPEKPYVVSEYGDWEYYAQNAGLNQDSWQDLQEDERTSRQLLSSGEKRLLQQATNTQEAHNDNFNTPAFADGYWVMFDYNRGYADDLEASGIMSINRLPKFSYYFYKSQRDASEVSERYSSGPMVYIASYWTEASNPAVRVFSNCEAVALYLNDSLISRQQPDRNKLSGNLPHPPFTFVLPSFVPGSLHAKGFINDLEKATHAIATPGKAVTLKVWVDESMKLPKAGVQDAVFVYAALTDAKGTVVPLNNIKVTFVIQGEASLISPATQSTEAGIASALLRVGNTPGKITVQVRSSTTGSGELSFHSH